MDGSALSSDEDFRRALLSTLFELKIPQHSGAALRPGFLIALIGFDDGERQEMTEECCHELAQKGLIALLQPTEKGGLLYALSALCLRGHEAPEAAIGCAVVLPAPRQVGAADPKTVAEQLFSVVSGQKVVAIAADKQAEARLLCSDYGVPLWPLGRSGGRELVVRASQGDRGFAEVLRVPLSALFAAAQTDLGKKI